MLDDRKQQVIDKVNQLRDIVKERWGIDLGDIRVEFNLKGGTVGLATSFGPKANTLKFNPKVMLDDAGWNHIINYTVAHEVAHLVCFADPSMGRNHNAGWQRVCVRLGGSGQRLAHGIKVEPARKVRKFAYVATCGTAVVLTSVRHNRIQRGEVYTFRNTGGKLDRSCTYRQVA